MKRIIARMITVGLFFMTAMVYGQDLDMVKIPGRDFKMLRTEVTQDLYVSVIGENPSKHKGGNFPVESLSRFDAIYFCNMLSMREGLKPVYVVDGETDATKWNYIPHKGNYLGSTGWEDVDSSANGYRLPTLEEWQYAAAGGESYKYAGSDDLDEVAWCFSNSDNTTHTVAQKKANGYGLYDMSGNVLEWCWDVDPSTHGDACFFFCGGSYAGGGNISVKNSIFGDLNGPNLGFRIVCSAK